MSRSQSPRPRPDAPPPTPLGHPCSPPLGAAACFVYYVVLCIVRLGPTLRRLRSSRIGWLAVGVGLEAFSMFGDIEMFRGVFGVRGTPNGWRRTAEF
jgi:hypothetical protein